MTTTRAARKGRTAAAPVTPDALDALLRVAEARGPALRKAGYTRIVIGELDLRIAPEPPPAPPKDDGDDDADEDLLASYRGSSAPRDRVRRPGVDE
jgi:hypothetical protein